MTEKDFIPFTGKALANWIEGHAFNSKEVEFKGELPSSETVAEVENIPPYFPSNGLVKAIEYARIVGRPLLLRGEPGCGKTKVAQALAYELYADKPDKNYRNYFFEWHIKSTTQAKDGLYHFDHLARLRDAQDPNTEKKDTFSYRTFGPLGKAFLQSTEDTPVVLLIDEIDKASLDFPNDLLLELDEKRFFVDETEEEIRAQHPPIVIITSNDEKELPSAFLRRCVFHYVDFPSKEELIRIAKARMARKKMKDENAKLLPEELVDQLSKQFVELRAQMKRDPNTDKLPSTSEYIDWMRVIEHFFLKDELPLVDGKFPEGQLPFPEVLFKSLDDFKNKEIR